MTEAIAHNPRQVHRFILLTDIAGSSRLAEAYPLEYTRALAEHNALIEQAVRNCGGSVYKNTGDGYFALFESAGSCVACTAELAVSLAGIAPLVESEPLLVRIALHAGALQPSGAEFFGPPLNRVSRICQVCNPGQVLLSGAVTSALGKLRDGFMLVDQGQHHLRDLSEPEHLYQLDNASFARRAFPPLATLNNRPNNLVRQPNAFIGREKELGELAELLSGDKNLITIIAPGGYGKSRLSAQLCAELLPSYERGAFIAYLAPLREAVDVPGGIASALGYQFSAGRTQEQQLCDYLRDKQLLLCLDNFEHLLDCAPLVAQLLQAAAKLKIIVTSREPLGIQGEQIYVLEPLALCSPAGDYSDAELLFADRAVLVNRSFTLTPGIAMQVQHFCEHLAGIPLAIELAAAWMDSFTLEELHDELTSQLELEARKSDLPPRHQSLKACLDWSWNLLGEQQQETLMRLSVFRGGFFSEAASTVLNLKGMALRGALAKLADKSWLYTREVDQQTRFFLRDMLAHEYAFEKLSGHQLYQSAVEAHAGYFAALAEREGPRLKGGGTSDGGAVQMQALRTWHCELENINEALDSALQRGETAWLLPIARYFQEYLDTISAYFMQRERYNGLLAAAQSLGEPALLGQSQLGLGRAHLRLGDHSTARSLLEKSLAISRKTGGRQDESTSLVSLALVHYMLGEYAQAAELQDQSLAICREIGDRQGQAVSMSNRATVHLAQGEYDQAASLYSQALAIFRELGNRGGEMVSLGNLATVRLNTGEHDQAAELQDQSLAICRELGNRRGEAYALYNLAHFPYMQGKYDQAAELYGQSLEIRREIGDRQGEAFSLSTLANIHYVQGEYSQALVLQNRSLAICRETGNRGGEAYSLTNLAIIHHMQGESSLAEELHHQSLAICREIGNRGGEAYALTNLGTIYYWQGEYSQAALVYSQALSIFRKLGLKSELALTCAHAAAALTALGALRAAAIVLHGGQFQAAALNCLIEPDGRRLIDDAQARLDTAVTEGTVSADELKQWQGAGDAMSLDELVQYTLDELAKLQTSPGVATSPPEA